jgi:two-component system phosphate regulon sensor histidine kinase PhoR
MKGKKIPIIIILTSIALIGVIITQSFWVLNAINLRRELLEQNINVGVKRVVNQIMLLQNNNDFAIEPDEHDEHFSYHKKFIQSLDEALIDSMITIEFRKINPENVTFYGIYEIETGEFLHCNDVEIEHLLLNSPFKVPISCIYQEDQFMLAVYIPLQRQYFLNEMQFYIILSLLFTLVIIFGFWFVINMLLRQKKLSEMKNDFVNNMTHELKTPIATISVASEMLMNETIRNAPEKSLRYAQIIHDENNRLRDQVEHVLQVAKLERSDFDLKFQDVDAHEILKEVLNKFEITANNKDGTIHTRLNAANAFIWADKTHLTNVIQNLVDNAVKYSPEKLEITVSTRSNNAGISIQVDDKGIGIEPHNLKKIFLQFHRVSTGDVHDVKGFGIGLYYVKKIVEAHGGTIQVTSNHGKGSSFNVFLPFKEELVKDEINGR